MVLLLNSMQFLLLRVLWKRCRNCPKTDTNNVSQTLENTLDKPKTKKKSTLTKGNEDITVFQNKRYLRKNCDRRHIYIKTHG